MPGEVDFGFEIVIYGVDVAKKIRREWRHWRCVGWRGVASGRSLRLKTEHGYVTIHSQLRANGETKRSLIANSIKTVSIVWRAVFRCFCSAWRHVRFRSPQTDAPQSLHRMPPLVEHSYQRYTT